MIYHFAPWPIRPNMLLVTAIRFHSCDAAPSTSSGSVLTENAKGGHRGAHGNRQTTFPEPVEGNFPPKKHLLKSTALHFCILLTRHPWLGTACKLAEKSAAGTGGARSVAARQCRRKPVLATKFQATPQAPHTRNIGKQVKYSGKNGIAAKKKTTKNLQLTAAKSTNILKAWIIYGLT